MQRLIIRLCLALVVTSVAPAFSNEIRLSTGDTWRPFTDMNVPGGGYATEIVARVVEGMGDSAKIDFLPWARSYELAKTDHYAGTFPWYDSEERRRDMLYSEPLFTTSIVGFVRRDMNPKPKNWASVTGGVLCHPIGYTIQPQIQAKLDGGDIKLFRPPSLEACFQMLEGGRADYVVAGRLVGRSTIRSIGLDDQKFAEIDEMIEDSSLYFLVSKTGTDGQAFLDKFNLTLSRLKADGTLAAILGQ